MYKAKVDRSNSLLERMFLGHFVCFIQDICTLEFNTHMNAVAIMTSANMAKGTDVICHVLVTTTFGAVERTEILFIRHFTVNSVFFSKIDGCKPLVKF